MNPLIKIIMIGAIMGAAVIADAKTDAVDETTAAVRIVAEPTV